MKILSESGFPGFEDLQDGNLDVVCGDCLNQDFQDLRIFRMVIWILSVNILIL